MDMLNYAVKWRDRKITAVRQFGTSDEGYDLYMHGLTWLGTQHTVLQVAGLITDTEMRKLYTRITGSKDTSGYGKYELASALWKFLNPEGTRPSLPSRTGTGQVTLTSAPAQKPRRGASFGSRSLK